MSGRERTLFPVALLSAAVVAPSLLLAWLSIRDVDLERAMLSRLVEEQARRDALAAVEAVEGRVTRREEDLVAAIDLAALRAALAEGPDAVARVLGPVLDAPSIASGVFVVDAGGRLVYPRILPPWRTTPPPEEPDEIQHLLDLAARAENSGELLSVAAQRLADRQRALDGLEAAGRAEFRDGDAERAIALYLEVAADRRDRVLYARAMFALGRCYARTARPDDALAAYREAAGVEGARTEEGVSIPAASRLRQAEILADSGRPGEAGAAALDLWQDLLQGRLDVDPGEFRFLCGRARNLAAEIIEGPGGDDPGALGPVARSALAARRDGLATAERRLTAEVVVASRVAERILPDLRWVIETPGPPGELRHIARIADEPSLVGYLFVVPRAPAESGGAAERDDPAGTFLLGFEVDLDAVRRDVLVPVLGESFGESRSAAQVTDHAGRTVALTPGRAPSNGRASEAPGNGVPSGGSPGGGSGAAIPVVVDFAPDRFPFWRLRVEADLGDLGALSHRRVVGQIAIIATSILTIAVGVVLTLRYVRKNLELARMKEDFVSAVSHELRTPLTSIRMFGEMLGAGRVPSEAKRAEYARIIATESERLSSLVERVLDYARMRDGRKEFRFDGRDLGGLVRRVAAEAAERTGPAGFQVTVEVAPDLPAVRHDPDAMADALRNLLANAEKYSGNGRAIRVRALARGSREVAIEVEDEGIGIPEDEQPKIFDKFYRGKHDAVQSVSGTGLGLALVKEIVTVHGGKVELESKVGQGSTFRLLLPAAPGGG